MKTVTIKGRKYDCYTIAEFAAHCGKSTGALRKLEERGVLPAAPVKLPIKNHWSDFMRLYPKSLVDKVSPILKSFQRFKKITDEEIKSIKQHFSDCIKSLNDA